MLTTSLVITDALYSRFTMFLKDFLHVSFLLVSKKLKGFAVIDKLFPSSSRI
uniref:Uncharacterized protein n=1 Tax=Manihot esculenta TaxID=3983 RepID=A0A2C9V0L9_MANES